MSCGDGFDDWVVPFGIVLTIDVERAGRDDLGDIKNREYADATVHSTHSSRSSISSRMGGGGDGRASNARACPAHGYILLLLITSSLLEERVGRLQICEFSLNNCRPSAASLLGILPFSSRAQ